MSRLGKMPIKLVAGTQATVTGTDLVLKGPKGEKRLTLHPLITVKIDNNEITVSPRDRAVKNASALWGLTWSLVRNAVIGVSVGFTKSLEINGVGYRATVSGQTLNMSLGFSHPVVFKLPVGISAVVAANVITLSGHDKGLLGETAARIRKIRRPEPYKGKGVKYVEEVIRRKAGKAAAKTK